MESLLNDSRFSFLMTYIEGSVFNQHDLNRASAHSAKAVFVLTNKFGFGGGGGGGGGGDSSCGSQSASISPSQMDSLTIMKSLAVNRYTQRYGARESLPTFVQVCQRARC